jgi:hypothetical protein
MITAKRIRKPFGIIPTSADEPSRNRWNVSCQLTNES